MNPKDKCQHDVLLTDVCNKCVEARCLDATGKHPYSVLGDIMTVAFLRGWRADGMTIVASPQFVTYAFEDARRAGFAGVVRRRSDEMGNEVVLSMPMGEISLRVGGKLGWIRVERFGDQLFELNTGW